MVCWTVNRQRICSTLGAVPNGSMLLSNGMCSPVPNLPVKTVSAVSGSAVTDTESELLKCLLSKRQCDLIIWPPNFISRLFLTSEEELFRIAVIFFFSWFEFGHFNCLPLAFALFVVRTQCGVHCAHHLDDEGENEGDDHFMCLSRPGASSSSSWGCNDNVINQCCKCSKLSSFTMIRLMYDLRQQFDSRVTIGTVYTLYVLKSFSVTYQMTCAWEWLAFQWNFIH